MTTDILTDAGEEHLLKNGLDAVTLTVGLYNDATDGLSDSSYDPSTAISTEPGTNTANYARQSINVTAADLDGAGTWGADNDASFTFQVDDQTTSETVDAVFITANFTSTVAGGTAGDWIIANAALSQSRDIGSIDTIDFAAGDLQITLD